MSVQSGIFGGVIFGFVTGSFISSQIFQCAHTADEWEAIEDARCKRYTPSSPIFSNPETHCEVSTQKINPYENQRK
jgi:hypothetical protein